MLMTEHEILFDDGAAYERMMGNWSQLAGNIFLDWLAPRPGLRWLDVGCGNGAFTELLIERCWPAEVQGIDASEAQLAFGRARFSAGVAEFGSGNAMTLPFSEGRFDVAVMALVIFFVPDPAKGVAEMVRVVRPAGIVACYAWDILGGGFPLEPIRIEMEALGVSLPIPPSSDTSGLQALRDLWIAAGLDAVGTREIEVQRTFADFNDFWSAAMGCVGPTVAAMPARDVELLKMSLLARLKPDGQGRITCSARANAVRGRVN